MRNLEKDLRKIVHKLDDESYAIKLYGALCSMRWMEVWEPVDHLKTKVDWVHRRNKNNIRPWKIVYSCSWRYAGGLVATLRAEGEDYLSFYCSGNEGEVDDEIRKDLNNLGWEELPWEDY